MIIFSGKDIYLRTKSGNLALYFLGYSEGMAAFRIPSVKNLPETKPFRAPSSILSMPV
jgi:hypothetical protein